MAFRYSIRQLKQVRQWFKDNPNGTVHVHCWPPEIMTRGQWHNWLMNCLHDKINRNEKPRGHRDCQEYFIDMRRVSREINHPRLIIDYLPKDLKKRFAYRLRENMV